MWSVRCCLQLDVVTVVESAREAVEELNELPSRLKPKRLDSYA